jgi:hypothetical protein
MKLTDKEYDLIVSALIAYARISDESAESVPNDSNLITRFQIQANDCRELADKIEEMADEVRR